MKRISLIVSIPILLIVTVVAFAQQSRGTPPVASTPVTISGTVVSFSAGFGAGLPTLIVRDGTSDKAFTLGPFWYLQNASFAAAPGDQVRIDAVACTHCANGYAVVSVLNLTSGKELTLRDPAGVPLWQNRQRGNAFGPGAGPANGQRSGGYQGAGCAGLYGPDLTRKASFEGTIVSFSGGPGVGQPELTVSTAAGQKVFLVAPYRVVIDAGYGFAPGAVIALTAAPVDHDGEEEWVVLTLTDAATGLELIFRDENGDPAGGHGHGRP
ncbi:MAG TPA: hypothetical protein VLV78_13120 [Thermoanaerobaculia bacterium]|nr:hypothetical protein [Thermoanaerobaculia bacterium]